jgi:hypothetical protein
MIVQAERPTDIQALVEHLLDPRRELVVIVSSTRSDGQRFFDAKFIDDECDGRAELWTIPAGRLGMLFSDSMTEMTTVYGGALRIYPKGVSWIRQPRESNLYFAYSEQEADLRTEAVIDKAVTLSYASGSLAPGISSTRHLALVRTAPVEELVPAVSPAIRAVPAAAPVTARTALNGALGTIVMLRAELETEHHNRMEDRRLSDQAIAELRSRLHTQAATMKARGSAKRRTVDGTSSEGNGWSLGSFPDAESAVRHAVLLAWVERIPGGEKAEHPLPVYAVGSDFAGSLESLDAGQRTKALKCVVDVLTDLARDLPARRVHPLRAGDGPTKEIRSRQDGAVCWRASVEASTASARRLHWWKLLDGSLELSRVVVHDDFDS